jgi:hypothetical protein
MVEGPAGCKRTIPQAPALAPVDVRSVSVTLGLLRAVQVGIELR